MLYVCAIVIIQFHVRGERGTGASITSLSNGFLAGRNK